MRQAREVSAWSKDPSTKVGAVIVDADKRVVSMGYNGFPAKIADYAGDYMDRDTKLKKVVHAEMNAIYNATHNGVSLNGSTLYVWGLPVCSDCARGVIQVGIKRVIMNSPSAIADFGIWKEHWDRSKDMFEEAGVQYDFV